MINASALLQLVPNLPPNAKETLTRMVAAGHDAEVHIAGLPSLPPFPSKIPEAVKAAVVAALSKFDVEFYQTMGFRISLNGQHLGGGGAKLTETLNVGNPIPNVKLIPMVEIGAPKE